MFMLQEEKSPKEKGQDRSEERCQEKGQRSIWNDGETESQRIVFGQKKDGREKEIKSIFK